VLTTGACAFAFPQSALWKNHVKDTTHRVIDNGRSADILSARAQRADLSRRFFREIERAAPAGGQDVRAPRLDTMQTQTKLIIEGDNFGQAI
jgi:hypothetical protein